MTHQTPFLPLSSSFLFISSSPDSIQQSTHQNRPIKIFPNHKNPIQTTMPPFKVHTTPASHNNDDPTLVSSPTPPQSGSDDEAKPEQNLPTPTNTKSNFRTLVLGLMIMVFLIWVHMMMAKRIAKQRQRTRTAERALSDLKSSIVMVKYYAERVAHEVKWMG